MKSVDDSSPTRTQLDLLMEYFRNNSGRDIKHSEIVDWAVAEYKKRTGKDFRDPDAGIRLLVRDGLLIKVSKGTYRYDPDSLARRELKGFTLVQKEATTHAQARVVVPKKKGIFYDKFVFAIGVIFFLAGVGCLLSAWPYSTIERILVAVFGVLLLFAGSAFSVVIGILGGV